MPVGPPGAPGAPEGPGGGRPNTGLMVGLGVLALLLVVGIVVTGVILLTRGGDDDTTTASSDTSSTAPAPSTTAPPSETTSPAAPTTSAPAPSGDSPEAVTQGFFTAIFKGDCATAEKYVVGALAASGGGCEAADIPTGVLDSVKLQVGTAKITGDMATVPVTLVPDVPGVDPSSLDIPPLTASLTQVDGEWKISNVA